MTKLAFNSNNQISKTGVLFHGKKLYFLKLLQQEHNNFIDLWYTHPLYGKADKDFNIVHVSAAHLKMVNDGRDMGNIHALNFVADAFNAMSLYLRDLRLRRKVLSGTFFYPLKAYNGWAPVNQVYKRHLDVLYGMFINQYLSGNGGALSREIETFDDFLPIFKDFLNLMTGEGVALTKSGLISKVNFPYSSSGLVIEIAQETDASDDAKKYRKYFEDEDLFSLYVNTAKKFGFYVDMNTPWRLVANLESPAWEENPILKGIIDSYFDNDYSSERVFEKYYHKAYKADVDSLKILALQFYNSYVADEPAYRIPEVCRDVNALKKTFRPATRVSQRVVQRKKTSMKILEAKYDDLFWLRLYMQVRLREMENDTGEEEVTRLLRGVEQAYHSQGKRAAVDYIAEESAALLEDQTSEHISLFLQQKNLLTTGQTPDIIL